MWLPFISKIEEEKSKLQKNLRESLLFVQSVMRNQGEFIPDTIGSGDNTYKINGRMFSFNEFSYKHCGFFIDGIKVSRKKFINEARKL